MSTKTGRETASAPPRALRYRDSLISLFYKPFQPPSLRRILAVKPTLSPIQRLLFYLHLSVRSVSGDEAEPSAALNHEADRQISLLSLVSTHQSAQKHGKACTETAWVTESFFSSSHHQVQRSERKAIYKTAHGKLNHTPNLSGTGVAV